jgi:hypothetical protein
LTGAAAEARVLRCLLRIFANRTIRDRLESKLPLRPKKINLSYVTFLAATAALSGLLFGIDIAIITGAGPFILEYFELNDLSLGWALNSVRLRHRFVPLRCTRPGPSWP